MCICGKCGEAYEADREHICRRKNSYPMERDADEGNGERGTGNLIHRLTAVPLPQSGKAYGVAVVG